ncbi:hypothetical protein [Phyllobacterium endophyticum]|uniref:Uncharacterized protein n=1 Tax=Phyllobacterium endophyticum TaxID=1149773 RepID=A0A2P7ASH9_9HYPH|nr:hypothetical protein [Phyllobacterium endophyticum]MBB3236874.1 hypothetical protein [Phyllobacterium endophyticum]PSH57127.1 hypothetical protein CU100_17885 [Phyllobacterium endophyticum]TYR40408.1 hypothetical protein FY050_17915 [Phyllobacterium endophyticum]
MNIIIARPKRWIFLVVALGLSVVILANIHLVYVAFQSRPDCVDHLKVKSRQNGTYRAANSAC